MKPRRIAILALTLLGLLAFAALAYAAGGGEEAAHGAEHHGVPWMNFILRCVNFVIFIGIIWYAAGKKIKGFFADRKAGIADELDDLSARQADAEEKLKNVERGIANLEQEKQKILADAKQQGETLKAAIIDKANKDAVAIKEQAKRTAENEAKSALDTMRAEMADLVTEAATKMIQEKLTAKDHDKLVDEYLTKVVFN